MLKAVVYFAKGYEEVEALAVVDILRRGSVEVILAGVYESTVVSAHQISVNMDKRIEQVDHTDIDIIILPGGKAGVENLSASKYVTENVRTFYEQEKWIAAICAAPSLLGKLGLLKGKNATCYPGFERDLDGCIYTEEKVVISKRIITAQAVGAAMEFGFAILEQLKGRETADSVRKTMYA